MQANTGLRIGTSRWTSDSPRTYEQTHPWINFRLNLARVPYRFWMLLGEASSKCDMIAGVPLPPRTADSLHVLYLAKGALATTAIEGNTLSAEEVHKLVRGQLDLPPSKDYLAQEVDNVIDACNGILSDLKRGTAPALSPHRVKELNAQVLRGLEVSQEVQLGKVRSHPVGVARYLGAPPQDCEYLLDRLFNWLNGSEFDLADKLGQLGVPILKAIIAHLYLAWTHPFGDGNGRTARLVEFQILVSSGVPSPAAHLLSNHYNETRSEYYRQLDRSSKSGEGPIDFLMYALGGFVEGLDGQVKAIRIHQWDVAWENYVHGVFRDRNKPADIRRRHLVLDLSERGEPTRRQQLRMLTPRLAEAYATKTDKTLSRDLNALQEMDLVRRDPEGVVANKEKILAFLPLSGPVPQETTAQLPLPIE